MALNKTLYSDYERLVRECHELAGSVGAVPTYGMGPHSPAHVARNPGSLTSMARQALAEGKRKVDVHRGQCIENSVNRFVNSSPIMRLPLDTSTPGAPTRPRSEQRIPIFLQPIHIPELDFLDNANNYCIRRIAYLNKLSATSQKWDEWTTEVADFYKTGIVKSNDANLTSLERTVDGDGRQIKRSHLAAFFTELKNTGLYSNNNESTIAMENGKNSLANTGAQAVRDVVSSAEKSNFCGATMSLNRRSTDFHTAMISIQGFRNELSNYINANTSCSTTAILNPITGNYRLGR